MILLKHQRLAREATCTSHPCRRCLEVHQRRVANSVGRAAPVDFVLPAFPGKSPNKSKVLGVLPDMAEQLSLDFLRKICDQVKSVYSPGARIVICSDGHVFSDIVQIDDAAITLYQRELRKLVQSSRPGPLRLFGLDDAYPGGSYEAMRRLLLQHHGEDLEHLRRLARTENEFLILYRGLTRFLLEDADRSHYDVSRAALQRICRERAYGVMQRSRAWGTLIAQRFPDAVRLSIHPQPCGSAKLGIHLLESPESLDNWITPWHGVAVDVGARFVLMKRHQAEAMGADIIHVDGRPSHFAVRQSHVSSDSPQVA